MDKVEAKRVLVMYRPGTEDEQDPEVQEALRIVGADAGLKLWLDQHLEQQRKIRDALRGMPVPADLSQKILARQSRKYLVVAWNRRQVLAAVAGLAVLAGLGMWLLQSREDRGFGAFRERMARMVLREYGMQMLSKDLGEIRKYLSQHNGHEDFVIGQKLAKLPGSGCAVLSWRGKKVSMVCFDLGNERDLYLFVIERNAIPNPPPAGPEFMGLNKLGTASWSVGDKVYFLAIKDAPTALEKYF